MLNKVFLQGRLTADPELRHTQTGTTVVSFRLAVERDYKNQSTGDRETDFIQCAAWRGTAEFLASYFTKGDLAIAEGCLRPRAYTDRNGVRRYVTEVVTEHVWFCGRRRSDTPVSGAAVPELEEQYDDDGELPF